MKQIFKYISASNFFPEYAPEVKNYTHKNRGVDGNGKEIEFSPDDKKAIKKGIRNLMKDLLEKVK